MPKTLQTVEQESLRLEVSRSRNRDRRPVAALVGATREFERADRRFGARARVRGRRKRLSIAIFRLSCCTVSCIRSRRRCATRRESSCSSSASACGSASTSSPIAREEMARLRDETGQPATLSALMENQVVVLEVLQGHAIVNFGTQPGTVLDLHASAHGNVALAFGPEDLMEHCLGETAQSLDTANDLLAKRSSARCRASEGARLGHRSQSGATGSERSRRPALQSRW